MTDSLLRALRRHHRERLKAKRRHYWGGIAGDSPKRLGKMVRTPKPCACWLCQHPGPPKRVILAEHPLP